MKLFQALFPAHRSLSLAGVLFGSGLLAVSLANPATWLQSGFETALNGGSAPLQIANARAPSAPIAGTEAYWLGTPTASATNHMIQPATWQAPVTAGDRFMFSVSSTTSASISREFEVVSIEPLPTAQSPSASGKNITKHEQFLVVCRSTDNSTPEIIKFLVDRTSGLPWLATPARTAHAL